MKVCQSFLFMGLIIITCVYLYISEVDISVHYVNNTAKNYY